MKLPNYVKPYSKFMHSDAKAFTSFILKRIYLPKETFENLRSKSPNHQNIAVLRHEESHLQNSKKENLMIYLFKFLLSREFRLEGEIEAYKEQFKYLKKYNLSYDLDHVARVMSSRKILGYASYKDLIVIMNKAWKEA